MQPPSNTGSVDEDISGNTDASVRDVHFRFLAEAIPHIIWSADASGKLDYFNRRGLEYFQCGYDTLRAWETKGLVHPDDQPESLARWGVSKRRGEPLEVEVRLLRGLDRSWRWHLVRALPQRSAEGEVIRWFGTCTDIQDWKATEAKLQKATKKLEGGLRESEAQYRSLVHNARDSIFTLSATGEIASLNPAFESITGWEASEWLGKAFPPLVHPGDVTSAMDIFRRSLEGEVLPTFELRISTKSGGYVPMEFKIATRRDEGGVVDVLGIGRDIRERRHLEEQLRQMQRLDSIGQLAAGIAHDFNNLLNVQKVHIEMMLMDDGLSEERVQALREISDATERAAALTRQLLLFSRRQVMQSQPLRLDEIVAQLARMLERVLGEDITLVCERAFDLPLIHADLGMTEQVVMNLVLNARDAMPRGGRLTLSTRLIEVTKEMASQNPEARPGHYVQLVVKDTGIGMASKILDQIFDPFFTTKDIGKGTGLGLSTVHGIVKQHQGWIEVVSAPDVGTTFKVYFPALQSGEQRSDSSRGMKEATRGSETILLVEDEEPLRRIMRIFLEKQGYSVVTAASGNEGLREWKAHSGGIDLLLTDLAMPGGMTGQQLARLLWEEQPGLRGVFTSGYSSDLAGEEWVVDDRSRFLQKPFLPQELVQRVRELLDQ